MDLLYNSDILFYILKSYNFYFDKKILTFNSARQLFNSRLVCKKFNEIILHIFKYFNFLSKQYFKYNIPLKLFPNLCNIHNSKYIQEQDIFNIRNLKSLELGNYSNVTLSKLTNLTNLQKLTILNNKSVENLNSLSILNNLTTLNISSISLVDENISNLTNLRTLGIQNTKLTLNFLTNFTNLTNLILFKNNYINKHVICQLTQLKSLNFCMQSKISDNEIKNLTNLTELHINLKITNYGIKNLQSLYRLYSYQNNNITTSLHNLTNLVTLNIRNRNLIGNDIKYLTKLKILDINRTNLLQCDIQHLTKLKQLYINDKLYHNIDNLNFLPNLKLLITNITDINKFKNCNVTINRPRII